MTRYGLPDESCMTYSATDHTKYSKHAKECPAIGYCMNCMPLKVGESWGLMWVGEGSGRAGCRSCRAERFTAPAVEGVL